MHAFCVILIQVGDEHFFNPRPIKELLGLLLSCNLMQLQLTATNLQLACNLAATEIHLEYCLIFHIHPRISSMTHNPPSLTSH